MTTGTDLMNRLAGKVAEKKDLLQGIGAIYKFALEGDGLTVDGCGDGHCALLRPLNRTRLGARRGRLGLRRASVQRGRVNAIAPGYHRTNMTRPLWEDPPSASKIAARSALKRWGEVDDLVGAVLFLASPASAFITGTTLPVDGGYATGV